MTTTLTPQLETDALSRPKPVDRRTYPEMTVEQTEDGGFRRQRNWFSTRFGRRADQVPPAWGRYLLLASPSCGWGRRQLITLRLLGLDQAVPFVLLTGRDDQGWRPYNGGGMHDPGNVTGGHFDHLHVTVKAN